MCWVNYRGSKQAQWALFARSAAVLIPPLYGSGSSLFFPGQENVALLIARLIAGVTMLYYGWPKIKGLKANADWFTSIGFKPGFFWGTIVAFVEFFGGIAMLIGFLVPIVALLFGFQMVVGTIWKTTKADKPFTDWSYGLILLALMLLLFSFGPGAYSFF